MPMVSGHDSSGGRTTAERLVGEVRDVESAIAMVRSGVASRVSLTGLRFAEAVLRELAADARREGIAVEPIYWPEDAGCDVVVRRIDVDA